MNVQIQAVKFDADRKLIEFVEAKMAKLDRFIERATGADVILKLDKDNEKGNKVAIILNVDQHRRGAQIHADVFGKRKHSVLPLIFLKTKMSDAHTFP